MRFTVQYAFISLALMVTASVSGAELETSLIRQDYTARIEAVRELGATFPGFVSPLPSEHRELGVWGGILLQTRWQVRTGRSELRQWRYLNTTLTLVPQQYLHEYLADPDMDCVHSEYLLANPTREAVRAPLTQLAVCDAWLAYFRLADKYQRNPPDLLHRTASHVELLQRLWRAHTSALELALWQYESEIAAQEIPVEEARFFKGWLRVVDSIASMHFWTQDVVDDPMLKGTLPQCAPLGSPGCRLSDLPWQVRAFVGSMMMMSPR